MIMKTIERPSGRRSAGELGPRGRPGACHRTAGHALERARAVADRERRPDDDGAGSKRSVRRLRGGRGDGRITAIGAGAAPAGLSATSRYDATGKFVTPGFISAHSHVWQSAFRGLAADQLVREGGPTSSTARWRCSRRRRTSTGTRLHGCARPSRSTESRRSTTSPTARAAPENSRNSNGAARSTPASGSFIRTRARGTSPADGTASGSRGLHRIRAPQMDELDVPQDVRRRNG